MFSKFASCVHKLPARSTDWINRLGPVALFGSDAVINKSKSKLLEEFRNSALESDWYAKIELCNDIQITPPTSEPIKFPVLMLGDMLTEYEDITQNDSKEINNLWRGAVREVASELYEKSYIPINVGGDGSATQSMIEAYKCLNASDEVIILHLSAHPSLSMPNEPLHILLEKNLLRGVLSIGNRQVTSEDRKMRKKYKVLYTDMHAIFAKNIASIRDFKNEFPLFISLNCDVLDPVFAPASIKLVPGGFTTRELLHILYGMRGPKIIGADIFGFDLRCDVQRNDGLGLTQITISKILKEVIVKAYTISTTTQEEGMARMQIMERQGNFSSSQYPEC